MNCPFCGKPVRVELPGWCIGTLDIECANPECRLMTISLHVDTEAEAEDFLNAPAKRIAAWMRGAKVRERNMRIYCHADGTPIVDTLADDIERGGWKKGTE